MQLNLNTKYSLFTTWLFLCPIVSGLELIPLRESETYPVIPADPFINIEWFKSVERWYAPLWSRRNLYTTLEAAVGEEEFVGLTDADLTKSCISIGSMGKDPVVFNTFGHSFNIPRAYFNPIRPGVFDWEIKKGQVKQSIIVQSDNKSYAVIVSILPDAGVGFVVLSTETSIEPKLKKITKKLLMSGFKEEAFYHLDASCDAQKPSDKSEL